MAAEKLGARTASCPTSRMREQEARQPPAPQSAQWSGCAEFRNRIRAECNPVVNRVVQRLGLRRSATMAAHGEATDQARRQLPSPGRATPSADGRGRSPPCRRVARRAPRQRQAPRDPVDRTQAGDPAAHAAGAPEARARGPRHDFREVRPDHVDPGRHLPSRVPSRAGPAARRGAAGARRRHSQDCRCRAWPPDRRCLRVLRPRASRQCVDRPGPRRHHQGGSLRCRQGVLPFVQHLLAEPNALAGGLGRGGAPESSEGVGGNPEPAAGDAVGVHPEPPLAGAGDPGDHL